MARGGPSTGGSKGGGNVVPTNQPTMSDNAYRSSRPFPSGNRQSISPRSYTDIFTGPRQPTMGVVAGDYTYGKGLPRRFPSPQPRYPMPRNPYGQPPSRYGRMQGPTGLSSFLSSQPAISQRQIDPATGFPARPQSYGAVMGRPDFGSIGRNASKGKSGSKGGAKTVRSPDQGRETNRQPQPDIGMDPYGTQSFKIDRDILDRGTVMNPAYRSLAGQDGPQAREGQLAPIPGLMTAPPPTPLTVQQRTGFSGAMEQAGGRPNIRPAMNVGKATGGPVGLASLIGRY